jgi:hypothetical protein
MYPPSVDDRFMRSHVEERIARAEHARRADEARRARRRRSLGTAIEAAAARVAPGPEASEWVAQTTPTLRDQGMPTEEIDAILTADDPDVIRIYLELHRERLEERLADQRRTIGHLEQVLTWGAKESRQPGGTDASRDVVRVRSYPRGIR